MRIVVGTGGPDREVVLTVHHPDATVNDLLDALGANRSAPGLIVGNRQVDRARRIADVGLHEGAEVRLVMRPAGPGHAGTYVYVLAGLDGGRRLPLSTGTSRLGRSSPSDLVVSHPTVSHVHCEVELSADGGVAVRDSQSRNGTLVDGKGIDAGVSVALEADVVLSVGAVDLRVGSWRVDDRPVGVDPSRHVGGASTIPFNRPPRSALKTSAPALAVPRPPPENSRTPLGLATILSPLVMAVAMIAITRRPEYALFAFLSPVGAVFSWWESSRRTQRSASTASRQYLAEVETFAQQVETMRAAEASGRRTATPDVAEVLRRATLPSVRLWERRPDHDDFLRLSAGMGDVSWRPDLTDPPPSLPPEVAEVLTRHDVLPRVPIDVSLAKGGVVGLFGDRAPALALARRLICEAAVLHGPADLRVTVLVDGDRRAEWDWVKWLPHSRNLAGPSGARWLSSNPDDSDQVLQELLAGRTKAVTLAVIDSDTLTEGRRGSLARALLRGDGGLAAGLIIGSTEHVLPAVCNTVIHLRGEIGGALLRRPQSGEVVGPFLIGGLAEASARSCARALARFEDPELEVPGASVPDQVPLVPLLGLESVDGEAVLERWHRSGADPGLVAPLGVGEDGVFRLDLDRDGPHGLVGGTTGSGKSELLRTLVAGMAAHADPDHLNFVLVDYKGGAAFKECSKLPHTVGMVTDLDPQLGERALRCLEAELRHRERMLDAAGVGSLRDYLRKGGGVPLPRLLVVIDEFATLAAELPDFVSSLVGIAQRGRSLGVHLILATQRPSGVVNDNIRANTNLRIALRVQDASDSSDVIGCPDAASISRERPGRAYVRLGQGDVTPIQSALSTLTPRARTANVEVAPFIFGPLGIAPPPAPRAIPGGGDETPTDLARLVAAMVDAHRLAGLAEPRRPWPEPLPVALDLGTLAVTDGLGPETTLVVALADDPEAQTQYPAGWDLLSGNLLVYGIAGSGSTETLGALALAVGRQWSPDDAHLYFLDFGAGQLAPLTGLPHTGAVLGARERERHLRLLRFLRAELDVRRGRSPSDAEPPRIVVFVDNAAGFFSEFSDIAMMDATDQFGRLFAEGPEVGIHMAMSADRVGAVPTALATVAPNKWVFRLADRGDYAGFGLRWGEVPTPVLGRAVVVETKQVVQVGRPEGGLDVGVSEVAGRWSRPSRMPRPIAVLPENVDVGALPAPSLADRPWLIPIGIGDADLGLACLCLYEGEHLLVAGPARSGRTSTLWALAEALRRCANAPLLLGVAPARSPFRACPHLGEVVTSASELAPVLASAGERALVVLVDDADTVDDPGGVLEQLLAQRRPDHHLVAAGRSDVLRSLYSHWTQTVRRTRSGVLLKPDLDLDGALLGATLPRRQLLPVQPGRGYLVTNGEAALVQFAQPQPTDESLAKGSGECHRAGTIGSGTGDEVPDGREIALFSVEPTLPRFSVPASEGDEP